LVESQQLDIFIPLQRRARLHAWAALAREQGLDPGSSGWVSEFARWLQANGHAPAGVSFAGLELLVAVMHEYESVDRRALPVAAS
jgi:hypothetical protein